MITQIYNHLMDSYGPQGWWPIVGYKGTNPTKTGSVNGYHPGDYSFPRNKSEQFEICIGAILTQNTAWPNVEKALTNLRRANSVDPKSIKRLSDGKLKELIKPAGYYNQKAGYIRDFIGFYEKLNGRTPSRDELLNIKGIGPETADSMLLYAFKTPSFVVDTYTRRIFHNLGLIEEKATYDEIKLLFEGSLKPDLMVYQEYHALIVEHAKRYYSKKEMYHQCPLYKQFHK